MADQPTEKMSSKALILVLTPILVVFAVFGFYKLSRGDWPLALQILTFIPACVGMALMVRRLEAIKAARGPSPRRQFLEGYVQLLPLALCFSFMELTKEMTAADAIASVACAFAVIAGLGAVALWSGLTIAERFLPTRDNDGSA